jgi:hypothetical protein
VSCTKKNKILEKPRKAQLVRMARSRRVRVGALFHPWKRRHPGIPAGQMRVCAGQGACAEGARIFAGRENRYMYDRVAIDWLKCTTHMENILLLICGYRRNRRFIFSKVSAWSANPSAPLGKRTRVLPRFLEFLLFFYQ